MRHCLARFLLAVTVSLPLAAILGAQAAVTPPKLAIESHTLENGLTVVLAPDTSRPVVNVQVWYHVGSKDERQGRTGFAHLFEHMMFRGSANVGPEEHMRLVREAGGTINAYTNFDRTVYWQTVPSNHLERILWLEADRMASLVVNAENFQKEREVVKEERRLRVENPPYGMLAEWVLDATFQAYPYKHLPIGSMDDLNAATAADVKEFFETFYVPDNATLVIVGDIEPKAALAQARTHFGRIPKSGKVPRVTAQEPPQTELRVLRKADQKAPLPAVASAFKLPPRGHADTYALQVAFDILSAGESSRLYRRLVYEEQSAVAAQAQLLLLEGPSIGFLFGVANQGRDVKDVASSIRKVVNGLAESPPSAEEVDKVRNTIVSRLIVERQTMQQKADSVGEASSLLGDPQRYNTELRKYQAVTAADVQRVIGQYLSEARETRLFIQPGTAGAEPHQASSGR
ncbi:MAG TPA: pitrilysin family protein [Vicinamibacterales bacterium]|nr:pitrilysin family protein [Vicinamibacterales bacterium]